MEDASHQPYYPNDGEQHEHGHGMDDVGGRPGGAGLGAGQQYHPGHQITSHGHPHAHKMQQMHQIQHHMPRGMHMHMQHTQHPSHPGMTPHSAYPGMPQGMVSGTSSGVFGLVVPHGSFIWYQTTRLPLTITRACDDMIEMGNLCVF